MENNTKNTNNINPEYLGAVLINGEYHDKKTAKFLFLKETEGTEGTENTINKSEDISDSFYTKFMNLFKSK